MATSTWATLPLTTAIVGPKCWRDSTIQNIKDAQNILQKSNRGSDDSKLLDPLPTFRDNCLQESNDQIHSYVRETRLVVFRLRDSLINTNEEIKVLIRAKAALHEAHEHVRKDIFLNKQSIFFRNSRPSRERIPDGADDLLNRERRILHRVKLTLEDVLRTTQKQLQVLASCRKRLSDTLQERSRVLELVNYAVMSVHPSASTQESPPADTSESTISRCPCEGPSSPEPDPIGPYTPEAAEAIHSALDACCTSASLRRKIKACIERCQSEQSLAHAAVNNGMTQKIAETLNLAQFLHVNRGQNRSAIHRCQRHYDQTERAQGYTLGPVSYDDLTAKERLDRPLVKVFQRHVGSQLPEANRILKANAGLAESMQDTRKSIALLHLARLRLSNDIKDKQAASRIDSAIVRLRRRRGNYRWIMDGANKIQSEFH